MSAIIRKEIRLLLPSFLIGVALSSATVFLKEDPFGGFNVLVASFSTLSCSAIAVFMALNSFGSEISAGTFSILLAQPVSRRQIWRTKTLLLAAALFIGGLLWCAILYLRLEVFNHPKGSGDFWDIFRGAWLFLLVIYSGALWTVLLLRQMVAAFWFTLLTPAAILVLIMFSWPEKYSAASEPAVIAGLLIYSVAGFWFARRLFLRAQDVAWTGGTIAMPELGWLERLKKSSGARRRGSPRAALQMKEFQLHQSQFLIAGALALLHLGVIATRKFGHFQKNSALEFVLECFWVLWLVVPALAGCAAAAEERKLGTLEGQLCLPVRRRTQFAVKAGVVLLLSLLFGVAMPLLLEGARILPHYKFNPLTAIAGLQNALKWHLQMSTAQIFFWNCVGVIGAHLPLLTLAGIATAIGMISLYASTLARNTLQALAPAVLMWLMWFLLFMAGWPDNFGDHFPWRGWLIYFIGVPVLAITLASLACWNFKQLLIGWQVLCRNTLVLAAMLGVVVVATTAVYHRAWEKLTPFEPPHGVARLSLSNPATLCGQWPLSTHLPDGRIWTEYHWYTWDWEPNPLGLILGNVRMASLGGGHFLEGSNLMNVVCNPLLQTTGIKTDGTLWVSEKPQRPVELKNGSWKLNEAGSLMQFGSETNWNSIVCYGLSVLLVKNDGTLWRWGTRNWNLRGDKWPGFQSFTPYRLGTESNWAEVFPAGHTFILRKTDGSVWTRSEGIISRMDGTIYPHANELDELEPGFAIERTSRFGHGKWRSTMTTRQALNYQLGVRDDGTFRILADQKWHILPKHYVWCEWTEVDLQIGTDTNWLGVAGHGEKIVTLKNDGTLWLWPFHHDDRHGWDPGRDERELLEKTPTRLGIHSDWIAVADEDGGIISLAADGSLWYWPLESADYYIGEVDRNNSQDYLEPLLDISRKPQQIGNIFAEAK